MMVGMATGEQEVSEENKRVLKRSENAPSLLEEVAVVEQCEVRRK